MAKKPRVFVSYSPDCQAHVDWVVGLATRLDQDGIEVRLDRWHLKPGENIQGFLETEIAKADKIITVVSEFYIQKFHLGGELEGNSLTFFTPNSDLKYGKEDQLMISRTSLSDLEWDIFKFVEGENCIEFAVEADYEDRYKLLLAAICKQSGPQVAKTIISSLKYDSIHMTTTEFLQHFKRGERNFYGMDLEGDKKLCGLNLKSVDFRTANLSGVDFSGSDCSYAEFGYTNLENANFCNSTLKNAWFPRANMQNADLTRSNMKEAQLREANLKSAKLKKVYAVKANFCIANLKGSKLTHANFCQANFMSTNMAKVDLSNSNLSKSFLSGAILDKANLKNALLVNTDLKEASLKSANLKKSDLTNASLARADLSNAVLDGAKMLDSNLTFTKLKKTRFGATNYRFCNFRM